MSRRIKPDRRNVVDRGTIIEITNVAEYPGIPEELVATMVRVRNYLLRTSWRINDEEYRDDFSRYCMGLDLCYFGEELDWTLKELRLVADAVD